MHCIMRTYNEARRSQQDLSLPSRTTFLVHTTCHRSKIVPVVRPRLAFFFVIRSFPGVLRSAACCYPAFVLHLTHSLTHSLSPHPCVPPARFCVLSNMPTMRDGCISAEHSTRARARARLSCSVLTCISHALALPTFLCYLREEVRSRERASG